MNRPLWMLAVWALVVPSVLAAEKPKKVVRDVTRPEGCALLDNPKTAGRMDGLLHYLAKACGREAEFLGGVWQEAEEPAGAGSPKAPKAPDVAVSDPSQDTSGTAKTQSETSIARNETTGTLCGAWNDSFHGVTQSVGFSGYGRSTNNGATWTDYGAVNPTANFDYGDPSLVWRKSDGYFYYAALSNTGGLSLYRSTDDCQTFTFVSQIASGGDDKEIMAVDNNPASPRYGRLYVVWTDFGAGNRIYSTYSDNGTTWSAQLALSATGDDVQGAWPVVAPNGDVFVGWVKWMGAGFPDGNLEVQIARSTDGAASYTLVTPPMTNQTNPRDAAASAPPPAGCGRPALKGNIRYLPSPTIAVDSAGALHAVYTYDPDATNSGDAVNVYYRRSLDNGATWQTEVKINDNDESVTQTDQYQPSLSVGAGNVVAVGYYSKQNNADNLHLDYYSRVSFNGGVTWQPSTRLSDTSSSIVLDPNLATCYHGDYDTQIHRPGAAQYLWSDDRDPGTGANPNIYTESTPAGVDFLVSANPASQVVCAGTTAAYPLNVFQFQGFTELVTLSATGEPAGTTPSFTVNPVSPGGTSTMNVTTGGVVAFTTATLTVTGTSSPSSIVHSTTVDLTVFAVSPGAATLTAPANGATAQPVRPTFTWTAPAQGAASYLLQIDDNADFSSITYSATVSGTSHVPTTDLASNTKYYWRIQATNTCGAGSFTSAFNFTTIPLPGDCPTGAVAQVSFSEGFETGAAGWTSSGTGNSWAQSTVRFHGGAYSWHANDPAIVSDQRLVSPALPLASGQNPVSLIFWNHQTIERINATSCYDGGILEVSTDGGTNWTQIVGAALLTDPYNGPVATAYSNPLAGLNAWCGDPQDWTRSVVDVTAYAGQTVNFRFRLGSDAYVSREGWYLDDVSVQSCFSDLIFKDGFQTP